MTGANKGTPAASGAEGGGGGGGTKQQHRIVHLTTNDWTDPDNIIVDCMGIMAAMNTLLDAHRRGVDVSFHKIDIAEGHWLDPGLVADPLRLPRACEMLHEYWDLVPDLVLYRLNWTKGMPLHMGISSKVYVGGLMSVDDAAEMAGRMDRAVRDPCWKRRKMDEWMAQDKAHGELCVAIAAARSNGPAGASGRELLSDLEEQLRRLCASREDALEERFQNLVNDLWKHKLLLQYLIRFQTDAGVKAEVHAMSVEHCALIASDVHGLIQGWIQHERRAHTEHDPSFAAYLDGTDRPDGAPRFAWDMYYDPGSLDQVSFGLNQWAHDHEECWARDYAADDMASWWRAHFGSAFDEAKGEQACFAALRPELDAILYRRQDSAEAGRDRAERRRRMKAWYAHCRGRTTQVADMTDAVFERVVDELAAADDAQLFCGASLSLHTRLLRHPRLTRRTVDGDSGREDVEPTAYGRKLFGKMSSIAQTGNYERTVGLFPLGYNQLLNLEGAGFAMDWAHLFRSFKVLTTDVNKLTHFDLGATVKFLRRYANDEEEDEKRAGSDGIQVTGDDDDGQRRQQQQHQQHQHRRRQYFDMESTIAKWMLGFNTRPKLSWSRPMSLARGDFVGDFDTFARAMAPTAGAGLPDVIAFVRGQDPGGRLTRLRETHVRLRVDSPGNLAAMAAAHPNWDIRDLPELALERLGEEEALVGEDEDGEGEDDDDEKEEEEVVVVVEGKEGERKREKTKVSEEEEGKRKRTQKPGHGGSSRRGNGSNKKSRRRRKGVFVSFEYGENKPRRVTEEDMARFLESVTFLDAEKWDS